MQYTAKVPEHVIAKLPEAFSDPDNRRLFAAMYKEACGMACVDMQDVHELDSSYYNVALYAAAYQLHEQTGGTEYFNILSGLEEQANETAMLEGIDIDDLKESRLYYVPAQMAAPAVASGFMPESKPLSLPYCDTYQQAKQMLEITPTRGFVPTAKYGQNGDKLPEIPPVSGIYTILADKNRVDALESTAEREFMNMFPSAPINPKTISEVDYVIPADVLHTDKLVHEDVAYRDKPKYDTLRREVDIRTNGMAGLQHALTKTPLSLRSAIEMYGQDAEALHMCFSKDGFVHDSPFNLTFQERVIQLALREISSSCNAYTLKQAVTLKEGFVQEFSDIPSMQQMVQGLQKHMQDFRATASPEDRDMIDISIASAQAIVNIIANERAESILSMHEPLNVDQRQYLHIAKNLVPEQLRNEFVLRATEQIGKGLSVEASVRFTARAMAKEAAAMGQPIIEDRLNAAGANAGIQYAAYHEAMENEELAEVK